MRAANLPAMATTHTVVSGDTLGQIAAKHKVALADLVTWNGIKDPNKISVGQVILLTDPNPTHTVIAGDTLAKLAATYELTVDDLVRWNAIKDADLITVGQVLKLSGPPAPTAPPVTPAEQIYVVQPGDTVSALAQKFGLRWVDIAAINKLEDMDLIIVGQKLVIPAQGLAR